MTTKQELELELGRKEARITELEEATAGKLLVLIEKIMRELQGTQGVLTTVVNGMSNNHKKLEELIKVSDLTYKQTVGWTKAINLNEKPARINVNSIFEKNEEIIEYAPTPREVMDGKEIKGTFETSKNKDKPWTWTPITITPEEFTEKAIKATEYPNWVALSMMKGVVKKLQVAQEIQVPNFYTKLLNKVE